MRIIQKEISLEKFTSRLPSVIPSYRDNKLYYFDDNSLKNRDYLYTSNYGMIPMNINISVSSNGKYGISKNGEKILSFRTISDWYHFFKEYYHLLKDYGHCSQMYSSATEYYKAESRDPRYATQMVYGSDRGTYEALDELFSSRGGKVSATTIETQGIESIIDVEDNGFYKWMCENIIPTFYIPTKYKDYWNRDVLFYPDVIRWIGWFQDRNEYEQVYSDATDASDEAWDCTKLSGDCCDCEEYFKRGGERILNIMKSWYADVQTNIGNMNDAIKSRISSFIPTMFQDISIYTSLETIGEMSVLSEQYEIGKDYRGTEYSGKSNDRSGTTVVLEDDSSKILISGSGFSFDSDYQEKTFNDSDWVSYTKLYKENNKKEFVSNFKYYAFNEDNVMITGNSRDDLEMNFVDKYPIINIDASVINGELYEVKKAEKAIGDNNKTYYVYRDEFTNTPYFYLNGKKVYAEFYPFTDEPYYYFTLFKKSEYVRKQAEHDNDRIDDIDDSFKNESTFYQHFPRTVEENNLTSYIIYNGSFYEVAYNSGVTINSNDYHRIKGYSYDKYGEIYYWLGRDRWRYTDEFLDTPTGVGDENGLLLVAFNYQPKCYSANEITGHTISKLNVLKSENTLEDDIGNSLEGMFNIKGRYNYQPNENEELEPLYQVGNTSNIEPYVNTQTNQNNISGNTNYFVGNIITKMVFYYKEIDGNIDDSTKVICELTDSGSTEIVYEVTDSGDTVDSGDNVDSGDTEYSSLSAITMSTKRKGNNKEYENDIYCDVTYYIGATLKRNYGEKYSMADEANYHYGVEYTETVQFVKTPTKYYLKASKKTLPIFSHTVDATSNFYMVTTYNLKQEPKTIESDSYGTKYDTYLANFKTVINTMSTSGTESYTESYDKYSGDTVLETEVYPTFMEEYRLGTATMQNVDSDIYIDRGINAAFEKHLKLGEISSLDSLENYGNGYFQIMEN